MGQILHSCARTTEAMRRAIQNSKESLKKLSEKYSVNEKTIAKWKKRDYVHDARLWVRKILILQCLAGKKRPSVLLFVGILCCRWTIVSTLCRRAFRI
jgi:hypothetical protein